MTLLITRSNNNEASYTRLLSY
ncbi:hypothetical protein MED222_06500 [Vibrio sp. MED222]|nr:hypothetical protein MED222_06500 [Vibrio sp. MED222]